VQSVDVPFMLGKNTGQDFSSLWSIFLIPDLLVVENAVTSLNVMTSIYSRNSHYPTVLSLGQSYQGGQQGIACFLTLLEIRKGENI